MNNIAWASYQIRKIAGCACAGNAGNVFPCGRLQWKSSVSDPGMHHGTCVTHVPWCMSGSLTRSGLENVPGIPGACAPAILRIWQEAHSCVSVSLFGHSQLHITVAIITLTKCCPGDHYWGTLPVNQPQISATHLKSNRPSNSRKTACTIRIIFISEIEFCNNRKKI